MTKLIATALLLAAPHAWAYLPHYRSSEADIKQLDGCVHTFSLEYGRFPSLSEGLLALINGPIDLRETNFVAYIRAIPKDPWGKDYVYRFPAAHNREGPDIYSMGEDGTSNTGGNDRDDINNWNKERPWAAYYGRRSEPLLYRCIKWVVGCAIVGAYGFVFWYNRKVGRAATAS